MKKFFTYLNLIVFIILLIMVNIATWTEKNKLCNSLFNLVLN